MLDIAIYFLFFCKANILMFLNGWEQDEQWWKSSKNESAVHLCLKWIKVKKFCPNIYLHVSLLLTVCTDIP